MTQITVVGTDTTAATPASWKLFAMYPSKEHVDYTDLESAILSAINASHIPSGISATKIADGSITNTEFLYLDWVTSSIQTQIDAKAASSDLTTHISDTTTHGTTGDIVGTSDSQILTNKTIDWNNNTVSNLVIGSEVTGASTSLTDTADITYNADTDISANWWVLDEDNFISNSNTKVPTQQSVKSYVDALPTWWDMTKAVYDPTTVAGDAFDMDNMVEGTTNKILTAAERTILGNTSGTNTWDQDLTPYMLKDWTNSEADYLDLDITAGDPAHTEGRIYYDNVSKAVSYYNEEAEVAMQIGQEERTRVRNESGATITNGSLVYISWGNWLPLVSLARADAEATYEAVGFATHDIENNTNGYITRGGIVRDVDTSAYSNGDDLYLSPTTAGAFTGTAPSLPNYEVHVGHVVSVNATTGTILVHFRDNESDYEEIVRSFDGMAFDKPDIYVTTSWGLLYFEVEKTGWGGDMDFLIDWVRSTLDCTTGAWAWGRAQVQITEGADANTPTTNYLYVTDSWGTATLTASTSLPTGAFAWIGKVIVPDDTTRGTTGEYLIQRYTEAFSNNNRGNSSHEREKLRALGAVYISWGSQTLTITPSGVALDSVHLEVASASVYQLHRQTFPAITTWPYYYGNGTNQYAQITDLNQALNLQDGTAITNNNRYNLVIWGVVSYESGDCKLFVNLPTTVYGSDAQASADVNASADYSVPNDFRSAAFMIARVVLKYTTASNWTITEIDTFSILGTPPGVRSWGSGAIVSTEFVDSTFRILGSVDATKQVAFEADTNITSGNTRTITMADQDIDLTPDVTYQAYDANTAKLDLSQVFTERQDIDSWSTAIISELRNDDWLLRVEWYTTVVRVTARNWVNTWYRPFRFQTAASWFFQWNTDGKWGINTTTPNQELTIEGTMDMKEQSAAWADTAWYWQFRVKDDTPNTPYFTDDAGTDFQLATTTDVTNKTESIILACSDETTALTTGTAKVTFRMPYAFTLTGVRASVTTAPTWSVLTVDINESWTSVLSTKLTIDATEKTSTTAATPAVISDSALADDAEITVDIDGIGSTVAWAWLKVTLIWHQ